MSYYFTLKTGIKITRSKYHVISTCDVILLPKNPSHDMPDNETEETSNQQSFQIVNPGIRPHTGKCSFCSPLKQTKRVNAWQADGCLTGRPAIRNAKSEVLNSCRKFSNGCSRTVTRLKIFFELIIMKMNVQTAPQHEPKWWERNLVAAEVFLSWRRQCVNNGFARSSFANLNSPFSTDKDFLVAKKACRRKRQYSELDCWTAN